MLMAWDYGTKCTREWLNADMGGSWVLENAKKENTRAILAAAYEEYQKKLKSEPPWLRLWTSSVSTADKYMSPDHHIWVPWGKL